MINCGHCEWAYNEFHTHCPHCGVAQVEVIESEG